MKQFNARYEEIILRDVQNPKYVRNLRLVWVVFCVFGFALLSIYISCFHSSLSRNFRFVFTYFKLALVSHDPGFRTAVFIYEYTMLFFVFLIAVAVFCALAVLAFDMQRRNAVIRQALHDLNSAAASEKKSP